MYTFVVVSYTQHNAFWKGFEVQSCKKGRLHRTPIKHGHRNTQTPPARGGSLADNWTSYQMYSRVVRCNLWVHQSLGKRWQKASKSHTDWSTEGFEKGHFDEWILFQADDDVSVQDTTDVVEDYWNIVLQLNSVEGINRYPSIQLVTL